LEQLFGKLRRSNLVESVRGPSGGYNLARSCNKISIAEIVLAVDEPLDATGCRGMGNCHDGQQCITHDLWMGLNEKILDYLEGVNLQQLVDGHKKNKSKLQTVAMDKLARPLKVAA
jgi:Rrf2 family iron-sulfur cluster assembly transcriptional regulator